jgi:peptidoglycan hydrolase-like protein with peptidoglycan-binding domain
MPVLSNACQVHHRRRELRDGAALSLYMRVCRLVICGLIFSLTLLMSSILQANTAYAQTFWDNFKRDAERAIGKVLSGETDEENLGGNGDPQTPRYDPPWIREIQSRLARSGFDPGPINGAYHSETINAIRAFQQNAGLPVDGRPTPSLMRALRAASQAPPRTQTASPTRQPDLNRDRTAVADTQRMLNQLGYNAGVVDGLYGKKTGNAIRAFQRDRGLPAGSDVTPQLLAQLSQATQGQGGRPGTIASPQTARAPSATDSASQGGGLIARAPSTGAAATAPPADTAALAQRFGLRTIHGRPVIQDRYAGGEEILSDQDRTALNRFFELIRLRLNPEAGQYVPPSGSTDGRNPPTDRGLSIFSDKKALCLANLFLSDAQKEQVLGEQTPRFNRVRNIQFRGWKGTGRNEFEVDRARERFATRFLPQIVADAPQLPLEFVYISRVHLEKYDPQRGGFPMLGVPHSTGTIGSAGRELELPRTQCMESVNEARYLPFATELPTLWSLDPETAEQQIISRIPVDQNVGYTQLRKAFAATVFTLSAAPSANVASNRQDVQNLVPLKVTVNSFALYEDPRLGRLLHTFDLDAPAPSVLLSGVPDSVPQHQRMVLDEEAVTLLLLKEQGDVLDREAWEVLARRQARNDQDFYDKKVTRVVLGRHIQDTLKSYDPMYTPFFPRGVQIAHDRHLTDEQLAVFKQWSLKRAAMLPDRFVVHGSLDRDRNSGGFLLTMGQSGGSRKPSKVVAGLLQRGYVPGQIVIPDFDARQQGVNFDATFTTGGGKVRIPVLVLANLLKSYQPNVTLEQLEKLYGKGRWNYPIEMELLVERTETFDIAEGAITSYGGEQHEGLAIVAQPTALRVLGNDGSEVLYEQAYQIAALDPNQTSTGSLAVSEPSGEKMPFSAEVADLLMAMFLPEALDQAALERMILARWHYETSFNRGTEKPQWGRFFVEGKPKPDAQQRAELAPSFKDWTLKRAQALPNVVTVVFPQVQTIEPGPMRLGSSLFDYRFSFAPMGRETRDCRSKARRTSRSKPALAETYDRACAFLENASTIFGREIYIGGVTGGSARDLSLEQRTVHLRKFPRELPQGVGPRMKCGGAIYDQDNYCFGMHDELKGDLLGQKVELDDVLVIDKEVVIPDNRPDVTARRSADTAVELDVEIVGVRRVDRLPPHPFLAAYRRYEDFVEKAGLGPKSAGGQWTDAFEQKSVPLFLLDARVREARLVENKSRQVIAELALQEPRAPDTSLLKIVEPERIAAPSEPFGPDVIGLRLGMSFDEADKIIREQINVGRVMHADRVWQTKAATGNIEPYTSGRLYEAEDGGEVIIIYDEPPAAPEVVLGLGRRVSFRNGKAPPAAVFASLENKYGKAHSPDPASGGLGQVWFEGAKTGENPNHWCVPNFNPGAKLDIWRNTDGSSTNWNQSMLKGHLRYAPELTCYGCNDDPSSLTECATGLLAIFETRQSDQWDDLVIRLFDQRIYAEQFQESKRLIEKGEGGVSAVDTGLDLKL